MISHFGRPRKLQAYACPLYATGKSSSRSLIGSGSDGWRWGRVKGKYPMAAFSSDERGTSRRSGHNLFGRRSAPLGQPRIGSIAGMKPSLSGISAAPMAKCRPAIAMCWIQSPSTAKATRIPCPARRRPRFACALRPPDRHATSGIDRLHRLRIAAREPVTHLQFAYYQLISELDSTF